MFSPAKETREEKGGRIPAQGSDGDPYGPTGGRPFPRDFSPGDLLLQAGSMVGTQGFVEWVN